MPLFTENTNPNNQTNPSANDSTQTNQNSNQPNNQNQGPQPFSKPTTGLFSLPPAVMNIVPWIPLMLEMTTGQKIPQMSGTMGEIQQSLQQIQFGLTQVVNNQNSLNQRLIALETKLLEVQSSANNLTNQFKSLRLTHTKEQKQIEYNPPQLEENQENY